MKPSMKSMLKQTAKIYIDTGKRRDGLAHHVRCITACVQLKTLTTEKLGKDLPIQFVCLAQPLCSLCNHDDLFADLLKVCPPTTTLQIAGTRGENYFERLWVNAVTYEVQVKWRGGLFCRLSDQITRSIMSYVWCQSRKTHSHSHLLAEWSTLDVFFCQ